jgi:hypothetical protein
VLTTILDLIGGRTISLYYETLHQGWWPTLLFYGSLGAAAFLGCLYAKLVGLPLRSRHPMYESQEDYDKYVERCSRWGWLRRLRGR